MGTITPITALALDSLPGLDATHHEWQVRQRHEDVVSIIMRQYACLIGQSFMKLTAVPDDRHFAVGDRVFSVAFRGSFREDPTSDYIMTTNIVKIVGTLRSSVKRGGPMIIREAVGTLEDIGRGQICEDNLALLGTVYDFTKEAVINQLGAHNARTFC